MVAPLVTFCQIMQRQQNLFAHNITQTPDATSWSRALFERMHSSDSFKLRTVDGTMKIGMGVERYVSKRAVHSKLVHPSKEIWECLNACGFDCSHIGWRSLGLGTCTK